MKPFINNDLKRFLPNGFEAAEHETAKFQLNFSRHYEKFALYELCYGYYCLVNIFSNYSKASDEVKAMIDRTPGMKDKINNFFN